MAVALFSPAGENLSRALPVTRRGCTAKEREREEIAERGEDGECKSGTVAENKRVATADTSYWLVYLLGCAKLSTRSASERALQ